MTNGITRRDPFAAIVPMDRLFTRVFGADPLGMGVGENGDEQFEASLAIDVVDSGDALEVHASLPGFARDDVDISVDDGVLTIKAERRQESEESDKNYLKRERRVTSVSRRVRLPVQVSDQDAAAELKDGVLALRLPKAEAVRPRRIAVN